jgi:D-glycero-D-manno-heptose 1,7-bisphosphate phosphatase
MSQIYWFQRENAARGCPCLFLDRDGVVVEEVNYLHRVEDVHILGGAAGLISSARARGWAVGLITNQAGIGRGYYDWTAFNIVHDEIVARLGAGPEPFDFVAACGAHPEAVSPFHRIANHSWRKPNAGMITMAANALNLDLAASALIGDQLSDLHAGAAAHVGRILHVKTGHGDLQTKEVAAFAAAHPGSVGLVADLTEARSYLGW